jgi:hypothetical protein
MPPCDVVIVALKTVHNAIPQLRLKAVLIQCVVISVASRLRANT